MDCPEANNGEVAVASLPDDSIVEILSRLPAKPLFRFKCVSKDWCGLIADHCLRCRKLLQTLQGFFSVVSASGENYGDFIDLSGSPVPPVDPSFSFLTKLPEIEKIVLLDSCNGLLLFEHTPVLLEEGRYGGSLGYIVCNPATEEWVSVPVSGHVSKFVTFDEQDGCHKYYRYDGEGTYLNFDPAVSPHFQLIQFSVIHILHEVYTFSSVTGEWTVVDVTAGPLCYASLDTGCPFKGMVHMRSHPHHLHNAKQGMILAFDGEGRPFRTLQWPEKDRGYLVFLGQSQGHLHCVSRCTKAELSIWVLEDYDAEKWVLRDNLSFSRLSARTSDEHWEVVSIHPHRALVFLAEYCNCKLIAYDMDKKEVHYVCSLLGHRRPFLIIPYVPYFAESVALAKKH